MQHHPEQRTTFEATARPLDPASLALRLYHMSKRLAWDPATIDMTRDAADFAALAPHEQEWFRRMVAVFIGGEEGVTHDLMPLITAIAHERRIEEEMYLTAFLFEEARHLELFRRIADEVMQVDPGEDLSRYHGPCYQQVFQTELPRALGRLERDRSPAAQARASVTYNLVVEGVLAESGHRAFHDGLARNGLMPGVCEALGHVRLDETRHVAYGIFLLSRLVAEHPEVLPDVIEHTASLMPAAMGVIEEVSLEDGQLPFGMRRDVIMAWCERRLQRRLARISRAARAGVDDVMAASNAAIDADSEATTSDDVATPVS